MAAIISTELIHYISPVLIFIFIWAILYAILQKFEGFGKNQSVNAAIAFVASLLFVIMPVTRDLIKEVIPWLIVLVVVIMVILLILMFMGYKEVDIVTYMKENSFGVVIVSIVIIVFLVALGKVVGPALFQYPSPTELGIISDLKRVILNPKTLGVVLILLIASYLIRAIAAPYKKG